MTDAEVYQSCYQSSLTTALQQQCRYSYRTTSCR